MLEAALGPAAPGFELELQFFPVFPQPEDGIEYVDAPVLIGPILPLPGLPVAFDVAALSTTDKVKRSSLAIRRLLEAGRPLAVAYSAGKDSSVMLALVLNTAVEAKADGVQLPPILVTHANTGIDNPAYQIVADAEIERIRAFIKGHELPARVDVVQPALNDSWAVRIISGRALPTFRNSKTRDCTISWKIKPQEKQRKLALKTLSRDGAPVVLVGTRYEESAGRAARMEQRGETDLDVWQDEIRDKAGKLIRVEDKLSPLAHWSQEDVWVYLRGLMDGSRHSYTNAEQVWEAYQDGGNSTCAVVGDDAMKSAAKACGARFGCALCTAVGRDRSLENMLEADTKYGYLRGLNRLQQFLVDTQYDLTRRNWLGRTIDERGFIRIAPDAYSPSMLKDLLRYALTIDREEQIAAARAQVPVRFQLVSLRQLIAIDAVWDCQGIFERPFEALRVWQEVYGEGKLFVPPSIEPAAAAEAEATAKIPESRFLYVGTHWDDDRGVAEAFSGLRDMIGEFAGTPEAGGCIGVRALSDGRLVMDIPGSDMFDIDEEGAIDFLQFEVGDGGLLDRYADYKDPTEGYRYYVRLGFLSTTPQHVGTIDEMLRRTSWKMRHGLIGMSLGELLGRSISLEEMRRGRKAPEGQLTLPEECERKLDEAHARRMSTRARLPGL